MQENQDFKDIRFKSGDPFSEREHRVRADLKAAANGGAMIQGADYNRKAQKSAAEVQIEQQASTALSRYLLTNTDHSP